MLRQGVARCGARPTTSQQHIDGVARASSAGTKSGSIAHSLVLLTTLALMSRSARLGDQLGLDDEANSEIADGYATGSSARRGVAVGDLPTSSAGAVQLVPRTLDSARTPPVPPTPWHEASIRLVEVYCDGFSFRSLYSAIHTSTRLGLGL